MIPAPPRHPRRLVFLGTPETAVPALRSLVEAGFEVPLVVSRPDRRRGRGGQTTPSPVKAEALALGIEVTDDVEAALGAGADVGVVVAYGRILRAPVLTDLPMINLHFSLLPRWRGAAPVERALLAGDDSTGVCVMQVVEGLDEGAVHARIEIDIKPRATAASLRAELAERGAALLVETLRAGLEAPAPQIGEVTYAEKITSEDLHLDWAEPALHLDRVVRVGGAWTTFRSRRLRVLEAAPALASPGTEDALGPGELRRAGGSVLVGTGEGALALETVQPEAKGAQRADAWANGARLAPDDRLGR